MSVAQKYFAYGTTLAGLVNMQTLTAYPPHVLPSARTPLIGGVRRRSLSGVTRADGWANSALLFDVLYQDDLDALVYALLGGYTTVSAQLYFSLIDTTGHYSPFQARISIPAFELSPGGIPRNIVFELTDCVLQTVTKSSNASVTTAEHYVIGNTASGNVTLTLPALSGVTQNVVYSFFKSSGSNNLVLDGNSSETIDSAATLTLTAINARADLVYNGTQWITI